MAAITTLAVNGTKAFDATSPAGSYRTTAGPTGGTQISGSSWLDTYTDTNSYVGGMIRHALPSEAEYNAQVAAGRQIFWTATADGSGTKPSVITRNGLASTISGFSYPQFRVVDLIYWDGTQALRMNPYAGTGPVPYPL